MEVGRTEIIVKAKNCRLLFPSQRHLLRNFFFFFLYIMRLYGRKEIIIALFIHIKSK